MNPFLNNLARIMLLNSGMSPEQIAKQLETFNNTSTTKQGPRVPGQTGPSGKPPSDGPLKIKPSPKNNPFMEAAKPNARIGVKFQPKPNMLRQGLTTARGLGGQAMRALLGIPGTVAGLALSDFGQSGENPDARARRLGYASLEQQQMAQMLFQQGVPAKDIKAALKKGDVQTPAQQVSQAQIEGLTMPGGMFYMGGNGKRNQSQGTPAAEQPAVVTEPTPQMQYVPPTRQRKAPKPKPAKPMEQAYGASGKDLYMAHKRNNPLMIRYFGKNYGSQKAE